MEQLCACSMRTLDPEHSAWVSRGRPCCSARCYMQAEENDARKIRARRAQAARDVPVGASWAFLEHRNMAEVIEAETKIISVGDGHYSVVGP